MTKYGEVAIRAAGLATHGLTPREAWAQSAVEVFPHSVSMQRKGCPQNAFLGLCEEGLIIGVSRGRYTRSEDNKGYALRAVEMVRASPALAEGTSALLWNRVVGGVEKRHNHQMDVVLALWRQRLIRPTQDHAGTASPPG